jgi:hypothetical protein
MMGATIFRGGYEFDSETYALAVACLACCGGQCWSEAIRNCGWYLAEDRRTHVF